MTKYPYVEGSEKIHDPELTVEATRLARLADMAASREPWQEGAAAFPTSVLIGETHPDLLDTNIPADVLRHTELHGAVDSSYYPDNTPEDAPHDDVRDTKPEPAATVPVKAKTAKKPAQKPKGKKR